MTPEEHLAREEIRYVLSIYNTEGDRGRLEGLASAFAEDGVLETADARFEGRAAIIAGLGSGVGERAASGRTPSYLRHNLTTHRAEFDSPTEAQSWTYFIVFSDNGPDHAGTYVDKLGKRDEGWRILHRRVKVHWISPDSVMHPGETAG